MAKILYACESIYPYSIGGMQKVARTHTALLARAGFDLTVVHSRVDRQGIRPWSNKLRHIPWPERYGGLRCNFPWKYPISLWLLSRRIDTLLRQDPADVVYAEGPVVYSTIMKKDRRIPVIFHPHGLEPYQSRFGVHDTIRFHLLKRLISSHCHKADIVLSQGGMLDEILENKIRVSRERIRHLPNCYVGPYGQPKADSTGRFLFVGRPEKRKRLETLLDFFAAKKDLKLDVVGAAPFGTFPENITFHGVISDEGVLGKMYGEAHMLLVPSTGEGMPTVILEAMSQGTPVIATDVGAISEVVRDGETGFCVDRNNIALLYEAIDLATNLSRASYYRMSAKCIDVVRTFFSETEVQRKLGTIINECLTC